MATEKEMHDPEYAISSLAGKWRGVDCFIMCGGPSLRDFDFTLLAGKRTIAVNRVPLKAKWWPEYLMVNDLHVWKRYEDYWRKLTFRPGTGELHHPNHYPETTLVSQPSAFFEYEIPRGIWYYPVAELKNLAKEPDALFMHTCVATAAIFFAWKLGAERIFLLGLDAYELADRSYFWGEKNQCDPDNYHELPGGGRFFDGKYARWKEDMNALRAWFESHKAMSFEWPGPGVYNLSRLSEIEAWPKVSMEEVLGHDIRRVQKRAAQEPGPHPDLQHDREGSVAGEEAAGVGRDREAAEEGVGSGADDAHGERLAECDVGDGSGHEGEKV